MKTKRIFAILLSALMVIALFSSCASKTYINPKLVDDQDSELAGTMGKKLILDEGAEYSGYLVYGYNMCGSGYFNSGDISPSAYIINMNKIADDGLIYSMDKSDTVSSLYMGETIKEYQKDVATQIGASYSYGLFFSSVSADFSISTESSTKNTSKHVYIKNQVKIQKERQFINTSALSVDDLKQYVNPTFLEALNKDLSDKSETEVQDYYEKLFETYGTHAMIDIVLGGRMDLNYIYNNSTSKTLETIRSEVNATYSTLRSSVTGSVSAAISAKTSTFISNTSFNGRRIGGSVEGDMTTFEEAKDSYEEWAESIQNKETLELVDIVDNCSTSLIPVWDLANADKKEAIAKAFDLYLQEAGKLFADFDNSKVETPVSYYIKDIYIGSSKTSWVASATAMAQATQTNPNIQYKIINYDLNSGVSGKYIYLAYTLTTNPDEAIKDIKIEWWSKSSGAKDTTYNGIPYTCLTKDLNEGAGGKYVYIYYTRNSSAGSPLKEIGIQINKNYSFGNSTSGWNVVVGLSSNDPADCNKGAGGPYIYMWLRR